MYKHMCCVFRMVSSQMATTGENKVAHMPSLLLLSAPLTCRPTRGSNEEWQQDTLPFSFTAVLLQLRSLITFSLWILFSFFSLFLSSSTVSRPSCLAVYGFFLWFYFGIFFSRVVPGKSARECFQSDDFDGYQKCMLCVCNILHHGQLDSCKWILSGTAREMGACNFCVFVLSGACFQGKPTDIHSITNSSFYCSAAQVRAGWR